MSRILSKIIVSFLSLLALCFIIAELLGVTIYFPFTIVDKQEVPYHRIQSIRLSVFLTFVYFGARYIFFQTEKLYPIQFLDIYLKSITICSLFVFYSLNVDFNEYYFVLFFFVVSVIVHFASKKKIRNYFN